MVPLGQRGGVNMTRLYSHHLIGARPVAREVAVEPQTFSPLAPGVDPSLRSEQAEAVLYRFRAYLPAPLCEVSHGEVRAMALLLLAFRTPVPAVDWAMIRIPGLITRTTLNAAGGLRSSQLITERTAWDAQAKPYCGVLVQVTERGDALAERLKQELRGSGLLGIALASSAVKGPWPEHFEAKRLPPVGRSRPA